MNAVKARLEDAEKTKLALTKLGVLSNTHRIVRDKKHIYFPVNKKVKGFEVIEKEFFFTQNKEKNLKTLLKGKLSSSELKSLKTSFDVIGDIAILEVDEELRSKEKIIAQALLEGHKNIKTVLRKDDKHDGEYRTQKMKWLAGINTRETTHRENNVSLKLNVETVYFSPRLSSERKRIAQQIKEGEDVLVMFSGCAPYPCVLSKNTSARHITGIELNPQGHNYGLENLKLNKIKNVSLINGDVRTETSKIYKHIIGLKSALFQEQLQKKMFVSPRILEVHLKKEELHDLNKLKKKVLELKKKNIKIIIHMPLPDDDSEILGQEDASCSIEELRVLGDFCVDVDAEAVIHISWNTPEVSDAVLIKNIKKLSKYNDFFYYENLINHFNKTEDVLRIGLAAGIKKTCIDLSHLFLVYKDNEAIINHVKVMQKHFDTYFHLSNSDGVVEGLEINKGFIDIDKVLPFVNKGIVEVFNKEETNPQEMLNSYNLIMKKKRVFDRILMPLPKDAEDFLDVALSVARTGAVIHFYSFLHESEFDEAELKVKKACDARGLKYRKLDFIKAGQQSPRTYRVCLDFQVF